MKTKVLLIAAIASAALLTLVPPAGAAPAGVSNGVVRGSGQDAAAPELGDIQYLFNRPSYQFWFTMNANLGPYIAGHSYHNVYKYEVDDQSSWCGPVEIPNRTPYDMGGTAGQVVFYKSWDVTAGIWVCGSD